MPERWFLRKTTVWLPKEGRWNAKDTEHLLSADSAYIVVQHACSWHSICHAVCLAIFFPCGKKSTYGNPHIDFRNLGEKGRREISQFRESEIKRKFYICNKALDIIKC